MALDVDRDTMRVIIALVNRLGGKVSLTEVEVMDIHPQTELIVRGFNTLQDDLFHLEVRVHGA